MLLFVVSSLVTITESLSSGFVRPQRYYSRNASLFTRNRNPVVMCLKFILADEVQAGKGGLARGCPKVRIRSQGTVKRGSLIG